MGKEYFVSENSVVRQIWGKADTILLIFAGASAEFALSKAVDWLYFTGKLPADPLGRLFSTVYYARAIVFSEKESALKAIDTITKIHAGVESQRGARIPDWAYRDVLFMLIDYSIRSFQVLERKLDPAEKREVFRAFLEVGKRMNINGLTESFEHWETMRQEHLHQNLEYSSHTADLFNRYRDHLGWTRYRLLLKTQTLVAPKRVKTLLGLKRSTFLNLLPGLYQLSRIFKLDRPLKALILPPGYKKEIAELDRFLF